MRLFLRLLLISATTQAAFFASGQVTKLANNNNITSGTTLGNIAVMIDSKDSLWKTDGTASGTKKYATNVSLDTNEQVVYFNNKIYFAGVDAAHGSELWVTDGTPAGTKLVKDITGNAQSSAPANFFVFKNVLYFFAFTSAKGKELYKSDGTASGTVLVKDINVGSGSSFTTNSNFFTNNNILYFIAADASHGAELWKTNGTSSGTVLIKDINPGSNSSNVTGFSALGTKVFFSADDGTHGAELWKTDGTAAGTMLVKDIATGFPGFGSNPSQFFLFKNKLYFIALDLTNGYELWVTDGTTAGTLLVKNINPGSASSIPLLANAVVISGKFYFSATTAANGNEIWRSDGTASGTTLFKDINVGTASSNPFFWLNYVGGTKSGGPDSTLFGGKIFFQANDKTHGTELWKTDGTTTNTTLVKDINPGTASGISANSLSYFYTTAGVYFAANNGTNGNELWKSDATSAGTTLVKDINPGSGSSSPKFLFLLLANHILFTANDGDNTSGKTDLYKLNATVDTIAKPLNAIAATAPDGRLFYLYPNPAQDRITVIANNVNEKGAAIAITNQRGTQVYMQQLPKVYGSFQYNVDIQLFSSGLYYLQIITDKGVSTQKFIKVK